MRVKEESGKAGLKLNIQKTKNMASSPITSWQVDGGKVQAETDCIFLGSKITADVKSGIHMSFPTGHLKYLKKYFLCQLIYLF